ncbi:hypothetical protein AAE02nite_01990 [Adhaeribacter aerolatus]|uniref:Uncharacterized protein n=1 Tax=Adhaeribacter aerolatus TaxID=670289 RepID=A0A512AS54_9BACT|nr:hypothetical protein [Adhaeribacter aerolatus]GEO02535.1 hypothetical protein AAE02nite_01990 [Adhaeribacter aerolatus]
MKKFFIAAGLLLGVTLTLPAAAQLSVINISSQPVWGPVGYDYVEYYYLPDIDIYYHVPTQQYVYFVNRHWVYSRVLPPHLRYYDFYRGYKVVMNEPRPYQYHDRYRRDYGHYRGRMGQPVIRDSRDARYFGNLGHPQYNQPRYATRDQDYRRDQYRNRPEPYYRRQKDRIDNRPRDERYDSDNRFRNDSDNRYRNDPNNRFRDNDNRFRDNDNRFRNKQRDQRQEGNRNSRSRHWER